MGEKLRNYQVLDVLCGGTFYKVRHKVTNSIFAWKAYNCSSYTREQIQNITNEVKRISGISAEALLRYYDTILHTPSKTLYLVVEYISWRSLDDVMRFCKDTDKYVAESFVWYLLYELTRVCKEIEEIRLAVMRKSIDSSSVYVDDGGDIRVNCFDVSTPDDNKSDVMRRIGDVVNALCTVTEHTQLKYSDDLIDVLGFLRDDKNINIRPDVLLYHPTVLSNLELTAGSKNLTLSLLPMSTLEVKLCDSERVCRRSDVIMESPAYVNVNNAICVNDDDDDVASKCSLSPTIAALALELPGYVPRSRRPITEMGCASPQRVTQKTLSQQWMSRLIALREREASLNKREREILSKEIINSPASVTYEEHTNADGITLPTIIPTLMDEPHQRRRRRRASLRSKRTRASCYEDLNSSLSADDGDGSVIITATKITNANMPDRSVLPPANNKRVHFTAANPFAESDDSVTLTFYELDGGKPTSGEVIATDAVAKFKYNMSCATSHCTNGGSPPKQPRAAKKPLIDITNRCMRRTPAKSTSCKSAQRCSMAPPQTEVKKAKSRKSLLTFKTPFKFMTSNKA